MKLDAKEGIVVDQFSRTSVPNIYAIGDVTNRRAPGREPIMAAVTCAHVPACVVASMTINLQSFGKGSACMHSCRRRSGCRRTPHGKEAGRLLLGCAGWR